MPVKIKVAGKSNAKPADKPAKPSRSTGRKATTRKGTTSARASAKQSSGRSKPAAAKSSDGPVRRASKGVDPRTEARLLKAVAKAGERRKKAEMEHKESINALHDAAREAITGGVSMAKVADESGISRQWLYKMGEFAEREGVTSGNGNGNGNGKSAAKPAASKRSAPAKRTSAKPAASRRSGARRTASKPAAKTRTRIRSRA